MYAFDMDKNAKFLDNYFKNIFAYFYDIIFKSGEGDIKYL